MHATAENLRIEIELPELPYTLNALEPHISENTLNYHYGKHHRGYVDKLNKALEGSAEEYYSLEQLIQSASGSLFNNAAQVWNHTFYWYGLSPDGGGVPQGELAEQISAAFGSFEDFKDQFIKKAAGNFASGWTWLVQDSDGKLAIVNTDDADNPMRQDLKPLLTCDVWEHAYYLDYQNDRKAYLKAFFELVNWAFVADNLEE